MIQNYSRYNVLEAFFDSPTKIFMVRELSRYTNLAQSSITLHLKALLKDNLILRVEDNLYGGYKANRDSEEFKLLRSQNLVYRSHSSGIVEFLDKKIQPECMIVFGSGSRGEDIEDSDIDIFLESNEDNIDIKKFEKKFNRKIHLFFKDEFNKLSKEIKNNIINGIKLQGYLMGY